MWIVSRVARKRHDIVETTAHARPAPLQPSNKFDGFDKPWRDKISPPTYERDSGIRWSTAFLSQPNWQASVRRTNHCTMSMVKKGATRHGNAYATLPPCQALGIQLSDIDALVYIKQGVRIGDVVNLIESMKRTSDGSYPTIYFSRGPRPHDRPGWTIKDGAVEATFKPSKRIRPDKRKAITYPGYRDGPCRIHDSPSRWPKRCSVPPWRKKMGHDKGEHERTAFPYPKQRSERLRLLSKRWR